MQKNNLSVSTAVTLALIVVTTLVMAVFGYVDYRGQSLRSYEKLHSELQFTSLQLSSSLALPLWNFQNEQAAKIVESSMLHNDIAAIVVTDALNPRVVTSLSRDAQWRAVPGGQPAITGDLIPLRTSITFDDRDIGILEVWVTTRFVRQALRDSLASRAWNILLVNATLVSLLSFILSRNVVGPLKAVESYALRVSAGQTGDVAIPSGVFLAELDNLRTSIENMVGELQARYQELQASRNNLAAAEERYRTIFENALAGIFQVAPDGRILTANAAMAAILGYASPQELIDSMVNIAEQLYVVPDDRKELMRLLHERGEIARHIIHFKRADGVKRWGSLHAREVRDKNGTPLYHDTMLEDITDRKQAQEELLQARDFIQSILDSMPSMVIGIDENAIITHCNRTTETMTGLDSGQLLGKPLTAAIPHLAPYLDAVQTALTQGKPVSRTAQPFVLDGQKRQEDVLIFPLMSGGVHGAVIRLDDVTDKARIEALILQTEKMMSLGGLAAGMAHEINNPLAGILQSVQNIKRRVGVDHPANLKAARAVGCDIAAMHAYLEKREVLSFLEGIRESGERAAKIVKNMLSFTHAGSMETRAVSLEELVDRVVEIALTDYDLKKKYDFRHVEIVREYAPDMPAVPCAAIEIEQVLLNLLRNAAQAMADHPALAPRIILRLRREEAMAVIEVEDNGPGMEENVRRRVFDPFYTTKSPGEGTGLGLSVSYYIITRNHGGAISVASKPGQGATFTIKLPLLAKDSAPALFAAI